MTLIYLLLGVAALLFGSSIFAETVSLESPDSHLKLTLEIAADGALTHALAVDGNPLTRLVSFTDTLRVKLAPGGGACVFITKKQSGRSLTSEAQPNPPKQPFIPVTQCSIK